MGSDVRVAMNQAIEDGVFPGAVLLVSVKEKILFHEAFGVTDLQRKKKVTRHSVFDLASLTKPLATALSVMKLIQNGSLSLQTTLGELFPKWCGPDKKNITLDQLLRHTSGLPSHRSFYLSIIESKSGLPFHKKSVRNIELNGDKNIINLNHPGMFKNLSSQMDLARLALKEPLIYLPGSQQVYSDLGYMVLRKVVEHVSGEPFDKYVHEELYTKLGISDLFFVNMKTNTHLMGDALQNTPSNGEHNCSKSKMDSHSRVHFVSTEKCHWREKTLNGEVHDDNAWIAGGVDGHAGLFGTAHSVWRITSIFLKMMNYNGSKEYPSPVEIDADFTLKGFPDPTLFNQFIAGGGDGRMVAGFDTPSLTGASAGRFFSQKSIGHLGFTGTSFWIDPTNELIVVLLTNRVHPCRDNTKIKKFRPYLHDLIVKTLLRH